MIADATALIIGEDHIGTNDRFEEVGLDSIGWYELRANLQETLGVSLEVSAGFDNATPMQLAEVIQKTICTLNQSSSETDNIEQEIPVSKVKSTDQKKPLDDELDDLSDEEITSLLEEWTDRMDEQ